MDLEGFKAEAANQGAVDVIRQSLYDYQIYATAGAALLQFFAVPKGQGKSASPGNATAVKSIADTNMQQAGVLAARQGHFVQSVEVDFQPGSVNTADTFTPQTVASSAAAPAAATGLVQVASVNDMNAILGSGSLKLTVGSRDYLEEAPLLRFPTKARRELDSAFAGNSATTANFGAALMRGAGRPYVLDPGQPIFAGQPFGVTIAFPAVVATPSGFNGRIGVVLDGWLARGV